MTTAVTVFFQRTEVAVLTGYGPSVFGNRPVRTRMPGGVGAGGENPPATRLWLRYFKVFTYFYDKILINLSMTGNGACFLFLSIHIYRMIGTFSQEFAFI